MGTSKRKRNPGLYVPKVSHWIPYISPFNDFLRQNNYFNTENKTTSVWRTYPIYLRETLFYFSKKFQQIRDVEVGYKFFSSDDLKE